MGRTPRTRLGQAATESFDDPPRPSSRERPKASSGERPTEPIDEGPTEPSSMPTSGNVIAPPAGHRIGRFTLAEVLGQGGMGIVVSAHDPTLDRRVAIKLVHLGEGSTEPDEAKQRLLREAQAMARLRHPNVVAIYEVGEHQEQVFLAMEQVDGGTLDETLAALDRGASHGWRRILELFLQAGRGLHAAHAAGLVHRDFKPENVYVDRTGRVLVGDFGLAHLARGPIVETGKTSSGRLSDRLTQDGAIMGTPCYMAPEQHAGLDVDARADQFAFCVALYEALYERLPFEGETRSRYVEAVVAGDVLAPPPRSAVPDWIFDVLRQGLAVIPDDRHVSMGALLSQLESAFDATHALLPGKRERLVGSGVIAAFALVTALLAEIFDVEPTYGLIFAIDAAVVGLNVAIGLFFRPLLQATLLNQRFYALGFAASVLGLILVGGGFAAGMAAVHVWSLHLFVFSAIVTSCAIAVERRTAPAAVVYATCFVVVSAWPQTLYGAIFVGHLVAVVVIFRVFYREGQQPRARPAVASPERISEE